jgi:hypothetical protein
LCEVVVADGLKKKDAQEEPKQGEDLEGTSNSSGKESPQQDSSRNYPY